MVRAMKLVRIEHDPFAEPNKRLVYVIRHGATALNSQNGGVDRIRGWADVPLSPQGRAEADTLAQKLADTGIDVLYYSTLDRAKDTAAAIAKTTGAQMVPDADLKPWNVAASPKRAVQSKT